MLYVRNQGLCTGSSLFTADTVTTDFLLTVQNGTKGKELNKNPCGQRSYLKGSILPSFMLTKFATLLCSKWLSLKVITIMTEIGKFSALICQNQHARVQSSV